MGPILYNYIIFTCFFFSYLHGTRANALCEVEDIEKELSLNTKKVYFIVKTAQVKVSAFHALWLDP